MEESPVKVGDNLQIGDIVRLEYGPGADYDGSQNGLGEIFEYRPTLDNGYGVKWKKGKNRGNHISHERAEHLVLVRKSSANICGKCEQEDRCEGDYLCSRCRWGV